MFDKLNSPSLDIYSALNSLNIKYKGKPNHKGWLSILCPFHSDHNFGSCSINIDNGIVSCWVCGSHHLNDLLGESKSIQFTYTEEVKPKEEIKKVTPKLSEKKEFNFIHLKLNPDDYHYTRQRGFTQEFVDHFNIVRCFSFPYRDYFAVPIIDSKKNIQTVEFRKLMQYEYEQKEIKYEDDYNYINDKKVKYETGSKLKETLFNIDNLNFNTVLYLCEGIGSLGKLWLYNKNSTCTFGAQISDYQIEYLQEFPVVRIIPDCDQAGFEAVDKLRKQLENLQVIDIGEIEDTDEEFINEIKNTNNLLTPEKYISKYMIRYNIKSLF